MTSRRLFLGSVAAAGVGTFGVTALTFPVAAQPGADPITREILRQLRGGMQKMQGGNGGDGARQLATTLRIYAATINDDQLRAMLRKANRQTLLYGPMNHAELERLADELGFPRAQLPHSTTTPLRREQAVDRLLKEGLSPFMRRAADNLDQAAVTLEARAARVRHVSLECADCGWACSLLGPSEDAVAALCALAFIFPPAAELCAAASAEYLTVLLACIMCQLFSNC